MIDIYTLEQCKKDSEILQLKITNLEHAIKQSEAMINESKIDDDTLVFFKAQDCQFNTGPRDSVFAKAGASSNSK